MRSAMSAVLCRIKSGRELVEDIVCCDEDYIVEGVGEEGLEGGRLKESARIGSELEVGEGFEVG